MMQAGFWAALAGSTSGGGGGGVAYPSVPAGTTRLAVWDVGASSTITTSGSNVTALADVFGTANATMTGPGTGLTIASGSSPNGTPGLVSTGASGLITDRTVGGWIAGISTTPTFTALLVMKIGTANSNGVFALGTDDGGGSYPCVWSYFSSDGTTAEFYTTGNRGVGAAGTAANRTITTTGLHKFVIRYNAGTLDLFHNSDAKVTGTGGLASLSSNQISMGRDLVGNPKDGIYYEMHLYSGAASDADCAALISYATTKHGTLA